MFEQLIKETRYAVRILGKRPGFTLLAVLSLAIGLGANTAIFTTVNALLLKELPYERPEELVDIHLRLPDFLFTSLSYPDFEDIRDATGHVFAGAIGSQPTLASIEGVSDDRGHFGEVVTGNYFSVLGVDAALGRLIGPEDDLTPGAHPVVVLSHELWQEAFAADPSVIGRSLRIDDRAYTIIGVAAAEYPGIVRGIIRPAFYVPMMMVDALSPGNLLDARDNHNMWGKARLAEGVSLAQAEAAVAAVASALSETRPPGWDPAGSFELMATSDVLMSPGAIDDGIRSTAWVLMAVVASILLIVCINLTGFLLARSLDRRRETAVRAALGATRFALVRPMLAEAMLLSLIGGGLGYVFSSWLLTAVLQFDLGLPITLNPDLSPDLRVVFFTLGASVLAGFILALVPALESSKQDIVSAIKSETAAGGVAPRQRWRNGLVITQLAVSMIILVGAGLFLRSLQNQADIDPGFGAEPAATMTLEYSAERFSAEEGRVLTRNLLERFRALPGVESVGVTNGLPLSPGVQWMDFLIDGHTPTQDRETFQADYAIADAGYFSAAGIALTRGRTFVDSLAADAQPGAIVSEAFVRRFWPNEDPIGKTVRMLGSSPALPGGAADLTVVGVAGDVSWEALNEPPRMVIYVSYAQFHVPFVTFVARTAGSAETTAVEMRAAALEVDPLMSVLEISTVQQHLSEQLRPAMILAGLLSAFAAVVLVLAAIGLHGVVSYAVATRTREVGIRMALGADASGIHRLVAASGLRLVAIGIAAGLAFSVPVNWLLSSMLVGIARMDVVSFAFAGFVLCATAAIAAFLPARRAGRLDPVVALRND